VKGADVEPNCIRLEKDLPESLRPGRVYEGKAEIEVEKKRGKVLGAGYWVGETCQRPKDMAESVKENGREDEMTEIR